MPSLPGAVVDASVIVNALVEQAYTENARLVFESELPLFAPAFARSEAADALWVQTRASRLRPDEALDSLRTLQRMGVEFVADPAVSIHGLSLAIEHDISPYDAEYIALAALEDCALITGDRKQLEIARDRCGMGKRAIWLGDLL